MHPLRFLDKTVSSEATGTAAGLARIIIGMAALVQAVDTYHILSRVLDGSKLRIPTNSWLPVIDVNDLPLFILAWCIAAVAFTIGWWTRVAGGALAIILTYSIVLDQQAYSNHVYLLILVVVLLTLAHSGNRFSIDAALGRRRETSPQWPITLLKAQLSVVYFFAAVSKVNALYMSGAIMAVNMRDGWALPLSDAWIRWEFMMPLALLSIFTETFLAMAFWSARYRYPAVCIGIVFHTAIVLTFPMRDGAPLAVFGMIMLSLYIPFIDADAGVVKAHRAIHAGRSLIAGLLPRRSSRSA